MKVMILALHFAEYASLLAAALRQHAEVQLVVYADNAANELGLDFHAIISRSGVALEVLQRPRTPLDVLRNTLTLIRLAREFRPDFVHIQEDGRDELVLALLGLGRVPVILTVHDPTPHSGRDAQSYRYSRGRLYHKLLRLRANRAITHGKALAEQLGRVVPRLAARTHVIPHGPLGLWSGVSPPHCKPGSPARLLFFGRIHAYKGLRYFVEAVRTLHEQGMKVLGIVAGRGSDLDQYRAEMQAVGCFDIRDRYIAANEVVELFNQTDLVVLPYTDATQSGVAAMALGYGIPVIATAVGSIPEFVQNGFNGYLVPPKDVTAIVAAIKQVLLTPGEYNRLTLNSIALRDGQLSWRCIAEHTILCYRDANIRRQPIVSRNVLMLGTDYDTMGGISSVVNAYRAAGLFQRQGVHYVVTHCDGTQLRKLMLAASALFRVIGLLIARKVDLAHIHVSSRASFWRKMIISMPIILVGKPILLHLHGSEFQIFYDEECSARSRRLVRWFFEHAARVLVLSRSWQDWTQSRFLKAQVMLVHNPVSMPEATDFVRREPATLLFLGRIGKRKGAYDLLQAVAKLVLEFPELRLIMGGDGDLDEAKHFAETLGISAHLELPGWVRGEDKKTLLSNASIYVLPSYHEGLPMSVLEAMAAGLPVVSTRVGGIPEAVRDGVDGFLIEAGDVDSLVDRLSTLLNDVDLRRRMGEAARTHVQENFSTTVILPRIEKLYEHVCSDSKKPNAV